MKVKVVNLNMWWGGKYTWANIISYLQKEQPDILMLQEVYNSEDAGAPQYLSAYASLQKELQLPHHEYEAQFNIRNGADYGPVGLAIFSKFPLSNKAVLWLQGQSTAEVDHDDRESIPTFPRNLLHCQTTINGITYNLMTLQGVWAPDERETENQQHMAQKIHDYISDKNNIILSGDFNVNENTESITLLEQPLKNIFKGERTSSFNMTRKTKPGYAKAIVDFIFCSSNIPVLDHYSSDADVSDHQSQVVILDL